MSSPDFIVDIAGIRNEPKDPTAPKRPWLAIHWRCCEVYSRIYRNGEATTYEGRCPRCARLLRVPIGPGGTSHRFFEAS